MNRLLQKETLKENKGNNKIFGNQKKIDYKSRNLKIQEQSWKMELRKSTRKCYRKVKVKNNKDEKKRHVGLIL